MNVWVDADACPKGAKELIFRAADRLKVTTILVANVPIRVPKSNFIRCEVVGAGFDVADDHIAESAQPNDLVITADIPLAARVVDAGALVLDPRGQLLDEDNVKSRLATRNLLADLRDIGMTGEGGISGGGPPPYKPKDRANFASALDRTLNRLLREYKH